MRELQSALEFRLDTPGLVNGEENVVPL